MKRKATKAYAPDLPQRRRKIEEEDVATEEGSRRKALAILIAWSWGTGRSYVVIGSVCKMVAQSVRSLLVFFDATVNCLR